MHFSRAQTRGDRPTHAGGPGAGACRWIWQMQSLTADVVVIGSGMGGGHHRARAGTPGLTCLCSSTSPTLRPSQRGFVSRGSTAARMPWASIVATAVRQLWHRDGFPGRRGARAMPRRVCDRPGPRDRSCSTAEGCARQRHRDQLHRSEGPPPGHREPEGTNRGARRHVRARRRGGQLRGSSSHRPTTPRAWTLSVSDWRVVAESDIATEAVVPRNRRSPVTGASSVAGL